MTERLRAADQHLVAIARHEREAADLADRPVRVTMAGSEAPALREFAVGDVRVYVCALGPPHPDLPRTGLDADGVVAGLHSVEKVLEVNAGGTTHVVLVSSVLALTSSADRRYYAGWKQIVEQELVRVVGEHAGARLSVLYPGRLIGPTGRRRPWQLLHTTYDRLAGLVVRSGDESAKSRVVGLDARAMLVARGLSAAISAVSGKAPRMETGDAKIPEDRWGPR